MKWNRKHLLGLEDLSAEEIVELLDTAEGSSAMLRRGDRYEALELPPGLPRLAAADLRLTGRYDLVRFDGVRAEVWSAAARHRARKGSAGLS